MNVRPLISVMHPTARLSPSEAFPRGWHDTFEQYLSKADHPELVEYVLAVHDSRFDQVIEPTLQWTGAQAYRLRDRKYPHPDADVRNGMTFKLVRNTGRDCVVDQLNAAAAEASGLILHATQDDIVPPDHWDTLLIDAFSLPKPSHEIVICSTGQPRERELELMIAGAMTRDIFERRGYLLDPAFESMYADNFFAWQARQEEAQGTLTVIERLDILFEHRRIQTDSVYALQNRKEAYLAGEVTFTQKTTGRHNLLMLLPGESFRSELMFSRMSLKDRAAAKYIVAPHGCYTSNVYCTRIELAQAALQFPTSTPERDLVLWVDDDNDLHFEQLELLVKDLELHPELGGVVGWCWCDHQEPEDGEAKSWVMSCGRQEDRGVGNGLTCLRFTAADFDRASDRNWLITSEDLAPHAFWSGFPVVLMRRSTLQRLGWQAFQPILRSDVKFGFTSEDTSFFLRAHQAGIQFAVDVRVRVPHLKVRGIIPQYIPAAEREHAQRLIAGADARLGRDTAAAQRCRNGDLAETLAMQ